MLMANEQMFIARASVPISVLHVPFCTGGAFLKGLQMINASLHSCVHYSYAVEKGTRFFPVSLSAVDIRRK